MEASVPFRDYASEGKTVFPSEAVFRGTARNFVQNQPKKWSQSRERGMEHRKAGSMLRMGNCMMPQVRSPVASMMNPPQPEKLSSRKGVAYCPTKPAERRMMHWTRNWGTQRIPMMAPVLAAKQGFDNEQGRISREAFLHGTEEAQAAGGEHDEESGRFPREACRWSFRSGHRKECTAN